jgi:hypothetical protein
MLRAQCQFMKSVSFESYVNILEETVKMEDSTLI